MSDKIKKWKILNSDYIFRHKWYTLRKDIVKLPDGKIIDDYFVSVRPDVVVVFVLTDDNHVLFVRQYKHGAADICIELPGGVCDDNEDPESSARREVLEETGYECDEYIRLACTYDNPTKDTNRINLYMGINGRKIKEPELDETENIQLLKVQLSDVIDMIRKGVVNVDSSIATVMLALDKLKDLNLYK